MQQVSVRSRVCFAAGGVLLLAQAAWAQVNVLTQHNDIGRTGQNVSETILTPTNVSSGNFGKLFSVTVDGQVYAQPLYVSGLSLPGGGTHNVVFVATMHDSVYAFDADAAGAPLWQVSLLDAAHGAAPGATTDPTADTGCTELAGTEFGITSTPVIDPATGSIYVVGKTLENGYPVQRLHALDITTGAEKASSPVTLAASVKGSGTGSSNGVLSFDPKWENQRPGLLFLNGIVYIAFASYCDSGPYHGWVLAYNTSTMTQTSAFVATPNSTGSGIWMSGAGLAADVPAGSPFGRMFVATGNGTYDATTPYQTNTMDYGDDVVRLDLTNGVMTVTDAFTPMDQANLVANDLDLASGGVMLLPDQPVAGHTHQLLAAGKTGNIYLVDRDSLGGYSTTANNIIESLIPNQIGGAFGAPAYWNSHVYYWGDSDHLTQFDFTYNNGLMDDWHDHNSTEQETFPGATPAVSANGTANGIVWNIDSSAWVNGGNANLLAHDALNVATTLYNSANNTARDNPGPAVKFAVPSIVNGKVYVATYGGLSVYGLLTSDFSVSAAPASVSVAPGGTVSDTITVAAMNGFSGTVSLAAGNLPTGVTASLMAGATAGTTTVTFSAASTAASGTYAVSITGTSGSLTHSTTVNVTVTSVSQPTFTLAANPSSITVVQGSANSSTISIIPANQFSGAVALAVSGLPMGVTAAVGSANGNAIGLTFTATANAATGTYSALVTGTSGTLKATTTVGVTVNAAAQPTFSLSVNPGSYSLVAGKSGSVTLSVTPVNGFNSAVTFSATGLPAGITASFSPASSMTGSTVTLAASSTAAGSYTVVLSGVAGKINVSASLKLTVTAAAATSFGVSVSSTSVTLPRNFFFFGSASDTVSVSALNGFTGNVQLSISGLPRSLSASFSPASVTNSGSSKLTLTPSFGLAAGSYTLTITGTSNSVSHTAILTVVAP